MSNNSELDDFELSYSLDDDFGNYTEDFEEDYMNGENDESLDEYDDQLDLFDDVFEDQSDVDETYEDAETEDSYKTQNDDEDDISFIANYDN